MLLVVDLEQLGQARLADVEAHEQHLLAQQGERHGQVGGVERLAFARCRRGEHDDLLMVAHHKLQVGTHGAEDLLHLVVLVLVDHDVGLGLGGVGRHGHVGQDGQRGEACHIVVTLNLVAEELYEEEHQGRYADAQHEGYEHDDRLLRADASAGSGLVDELALVGRGGE